MIFRLTVQGVPKGGDKISETICKRKKIQRENTVSLIIYNNVMCDSRKNS